MVDFDDALAVASQLGFEIYDHHWGSSSSANLEGVKSELVSVATLAIRLCAFDGTVVSGGGLRTDEQAQQNVENGTGVFDSRHKKQSDGFGHAIDCIPLTPGKGIDWNNLDAFKAMACAVKTASAILCVPIRQGCDWNMNGIFSEANETDWAHFENPKEKYQESAKLEMQKTRKELGLDEPENETKDCIKCPHCGKGLTLTKA